MISDQWLVVNREWAALRRNNFNWPLTTNHFPKKSAPPRIVTLLCRL